MTDLATAPQPDLPPLPEAPPPSSGVPHAGLRLAGLVALLAYVGIRWPWVLIVILAIVLMITLHELGHFLMAKRAGMKVTEFFLGFGPKLWSVVRGETEYGIKLIPAGAYVRIIGMHNLEDVDPADEARTYRQKSFGQRVGVAVAGSTMHFLLAFGLIFLSLVAVGQPMGTLDQQAIAQNWRVDKVVAGSAAAAAGLKSGDRLISVDGQAVPTFQDLKPIMTPLRGRTVPLVYERDGVRRTTSLTPHPFEQWFIGEVKPGSAADRAGLQQDDRIVSIDGHATGSTDFFERVVVPLENRRATVVVEQGGERRSTDLLIRDFTVTSLPGCCLGVGEQAPPVERLGIVEGITKTPQQFAAIAGLSLEGLGKFFSPRGIGGFATQVGDAGKDRQATADPLDRGTTVDSPSGLTSWTKATRVSTSSGGDDRLLSIVGLVQVGSSAGSVDPTSLIVLFALVNIGIGLINLTPLLPFDGGHVAIAVYEKIQEKRLNRRRYFTDVGRLLPLTYGVVMILGLLFFSTIYLDLANPVVGG